MQEQAAKPAAFLLSPEQETFIKAAISGKNILVDACIGSGKTTAIQRLCRELPPEKKILYLTYNKLLKLDAKAKITGRNVTVTNYHGFAMSALRKMGKAVSPSDIVQQFNREKPALPRYDVLILDEYQDIEQELAELLEQIKAAGPGMQIIAVGDMKQKIYDKTTLCVPEFIAQFLGEHIRMEFTQCFRLSAGLAGTLGNVWGKNIVGVNASCVVEEMGMKDAILYLSQQAPQDILCLGARTGDLSTALNALESLYPEKFNKKTVYASISGNDSTGAAEPDSSTAIFTTFDSSKGLERPLCVVFDYTESYWKARAQMPQQSCEILRNIFCVAASRGKEHIIFVRNRQALVSEKTLGSPDENPRRLKNMKISGMFDFKYKESVEECFSYLHITPLPVADHTVIELPMHDALIDLSPCIGMYQQAVFFGGEGARGPELFSALNRRQRKIYAQQAAKSSSLQEKILLATALETGQDRYRTQVKAPFITEAASAALVERLGTVFSRSEAVQVHGSLDFLDPKGKMPAFAATGFADVVKDDTAYELKFVSALTHEHFLQCACYAAALGLPKGILWNVRDNARYEITIPDRGHFLEAVAAAVTKNQYGRAQPSPPKPPEAPDIADCVTAAEAGKILGVSRNTIYHMIRAGELPAYKVKNKYMIPKAALQPPPEKESDDRLLTVIGVLAAILFTLLLAAAARYL